ncbi:type VI secretion system accessory protein TagJ [Thalassococcus sp. S3]|uniref:type VI secretion system accessory protein TagJ n=1 Tax=Thalassococcus sp. S3 TaxID=2017482 RepID=UPI0010244206|nr:type VI secretion system accessory protein TagJ [Thalassococcus sp. S3]QBF32474.1 nitrogen fixation protein [Thalassococcus sp. S3]
MTQTTTLTDLLSNDDLDQALSLAAGRVKYQPKSTARRMEFAQLLVLGGELERADTQARLAQQFDPASAPSLTPFRQYLRGLEARERWWSEGALPDFPLGATQADKLALALNVAIRTGATETEVRRAGAELEAVRLACPVVWNSTEHADLRDLDDRLPHALEAITSGGRYLWIDFTKFSEVTFAPVSAPLDLTLRSARVSLKDGSSADLLIPAIYDAPRMPAEHLARQTDFEDLPGGLTRAFGQRAFLVEDGMAPILEAETWLFR